MRALLVLAVACSGGQHAEPPPPRATDAAVDAYRPDAAPPGDAFETMLLADADTGQGRVVVTDSDGGCGGMLVLDLIYFAPGSSEIQPHQQAVAAAVGEAISCVLKEGAITKLEIQGHADDKERDPMRLSEDRALRIANLLTSKGVDPKILKIVGYGNASPLDRRKTAAARAKNRRVEFLILERKRDEVR